MSAAALAVYGDPASIAAALAGLDGLAGGLLLAAAGQDRATAGVLTCWQGESADAFLAAQSARNRDVSALLDQVRATRAALEALGQELAVARAGVRRVIAAADALGLRVRDDARAVYLPADFGAAHPDALAAPQEAARLTAELTGIWWGARDAWAAAAGRLRGVHPEPMPSHPSLLKQIPWGSLPGVLTGGWLAPLAMAELLAERDPAAADAWAGRQRLPGPARLAALTGKERALLGKVPGLRDVSALSAGLTVFGTGWEIYTGTDAGVAVVANGASAVAGAGAGAGAGAAMLALAEVTPPGAVVTVVGVVGFGVGYVVHWALETEPVQRVVRNVESVVASGFRRLARDERAAMQGLATAR